MNAGMADGLKNGQSSGSSSSFGVFSADDLHLLQVQNADASCRHGIQQETSLVS